MENLIRKLQTAEEKYAQVVFNTNVPFNDPAPKPVVAFGIGGVLSLFGFLMWCHRVHMLKRKMLEREPPVKLTFNTMLRAYISCAIDSDSPFYTTVSYGASSFLFLGAMQINYEWTLLAMLAFYMITSLGETVRVLLALSHANSLADIVVTSGFLASKLRTVATELRPSNVYEDLGRGKTIVLMVFVTQIILISFVCIDMFQNDTNSCRDGTPGCPIGGTLGSWIFYVLGTFMACVFLLGPKTNYGESEQNPAYWLQLFLATKRSGAHVTWYDPIMDKHKEMHLSMRDGITWIRFFMSFLINGVGFHILVHALPFQVAAQSSLTGVVLRAVGMMYLVDLDDTPGYTLTIVQHPVEGTEKEEGGASDDDKHVGPKNVDANHNMMELLEPEALRAEAQKIIEEARQKLEALARGEIPVDTVRVNNQDFLVACSPVDVGQLDDDNQDTQQMQNEPAGRSRGV